MNFYAVKAIYKFEMTRTFRTITQSIISPVISTALYFIVFGSAMGSHIKSIGEITYGAFLVPGLIMLSVLVQSISNASFGIYMPKYRGTVYEILAAPISFVEITIGYVGAAATKSMMIGLIILGTSFAFVDLEIKHPFWMFGFLVTICVSFSLFGFIIGIWAKSFEQINLVPMLVIMPLVFLGGSFYAISMLPPFWQSISMVNPVMYIISFFRWTFFDTTNVAISLSLFAVILFMSLCLLVIWYIFKTGYRLKT